VLVSLTGALTLGGWLQTRSTEVAEMVAAAGFDWVCVDMEHGSADVSDLPALFCAIERHGCSPVVRIPHHLPHCLLRRVLDMGARGIIAANVMNNADAYHLGLSMRRPPKGDRGWGYSRANLWGKTFDPAETGMNVPLVVQIESKQGLRYLARTLDLDGVAGAFIGPLDLAGDLGHPGKPGHPDVMKAKQEFLDICREADKPAGCHIVEPNPEQVRAAQDAGYRIVALGTDGVFLNSQASAVLRMAGR